MVIKRGIIMNLKNRHFLTLKDYSKEEIRYLLDLAHQLKADKKAGKIGQHLLGKNVCLIFEKTSTRTRCSFEVAALDEGGHATFLSNSQMGKKESIEDTAKVLGRMYDGIEFRGFKQETVEALAKYSGVPVWNGLTDVDHPTQTLADFLTIEEHLDKPLEDIYTIYSIAYINLGQINEAEKYLKMAVEYEGRSFTEEEERQLTRAIESAAGIEILCIIEKNTATEQVHKKLLDESLEAIHERDGQFYKGTLRGRQVLESEQSIVIIGDVEEGATVASKGNVIVTGTIYGTVIAGAAGRTDAVIAALHMQPKKLRIGGIKVKPVIGGSYSWAKLL